MILSKLFPRLLAVCFAFSLLAISAAAQTAGTRPRQVSNPVQLTSRTMVRGVPRLENDVSLISSVAPADMDEEAPELTHVSPMASGANLGHLELAMLSAIEDRIGTPYRLGTTGPYRYDCSGFVWSVFQSAGLNFERVNARTLWDEFAPATEDEKYKFGTLVFFNNVRHVGIVADEKGFYHASSSHGVVYSTFSDYWLRRVAGFRRVPLLTLQQQQSASLIASSGK